MEGSPLAVVWVRSPLIEEAATGPRVLREKIVYRDQGQATAPPAYGAGRVLAEFDGAGLVTFEYDFREQVAKVTRRVTDDHQTAPDWRAAEAWDGAAPLPPEAGVLLSAESWSVSSRFDATGRLVEQQTPGRSTLRWAYIRAGQLLNTTRSTA